MAKYTLELNELHTPFDFDYPFYDEDMKAEFERKFVLHYFFNEIGQETSYRFKKRLQARLTNNYPKYKQLYESELASNGISFLLNKDLKETFIREIDSTGNTVTDRSGDSSISSMDNNSSTTRGTSTDTTTGKDTTKMLDTPMNNVGNIDAGYLTAGTVQDKSSTTGNTSTVSNDGSGSSSSRGSTSDTSNTDSKGNTKETTELISQGNIGTTSSAQLLRDWRSVMINLDLIIIEDCADLFMQVY